VKNLAERTGIPDDPGIYELRIQHYWYGSPEVVYIGHSNRSLYKRIDQYCKNGSHKARWFNRLLRIGFSISMRYRVVHPRDLGTEVEQDGGKEYPDWDRYRTAEELETVYLKNYDYMLNVADNSRSRLELHNFKSRNWVHPRGVHPHLPGPTLGDIESKMLRWQIIWPTLFLLILCIVSLLLLGSSGASPFMFFTLLAISIGLCTLNVGSYYFI
jgi:hypothetical protein